MRDADNICEVELLDINYMGFVFYARSLRFVPESKETVYAIRRCTKRKIGVFVNATAEQMLQKADSYQLHGLQLHGDESPDTCRILRQHGYLVIKAFSVASVDDLKETNHYADDCDSFLFDTKCTGHGGSGRRFDWSLLDTYDGHTPFFLSGGLAPGCAPDIRRLQHPAFAGIDLNSGFEIVPGLKDINKLKMFITEIKTEKNTYKQ